MNPITRLKPWPDDPAPGEGCIPVYQPPTTTADTAADEKVLRGDTAGMRLGVLWLALYFALMTLVVLLLARAHGAAAAPSRQSSPGSLGGVVCETVLVGDIASTSVTWYPDLTYQQAVAQGVVSPSEPVYIFPNGTWYVGSLVSTLCEQTGVCVTPPPLATPTVLPPTPCPPGSPSCSEATPPPPPSLTDGPPRCVAIIVRDIGLDCIPNCTQTHASGDIPCMNALRDPYPRGLVTVPNTFTLNGPFNSSGAPVSCPDAAIPNPRYRNRRLQVIWRMETSVAPVWRFDERPWNIANGAANTALGFTVQHIYETSSFGLPANGPSLGGDPLEAYQVDVVTQWRASVIREWDQWGWVDDEFKFIRHVRVVDPINLAQWGHSTSYLESTRAQDPRAPTNICNIPTPIIEAQSILVP